MLYAHVGNKKSLPTPGARGTCPSCGNEVLAKCGRLVTHHWAHVAGGDCDPWSEPMGEWHRSWQGIVLPEHVEVIRSPHRADIVGVGDVVIELQHSTIDADTIGAREQFYGNMVWMFDATHRFSYLDQGQRAFFTLGRAKHLPCCQKRVFLDFGCVLVEVERWTEKFTIDRISGYGPIRDRGWFIREFLQGRVDPQAKVIAPEARGFAERLQDWGAKPPFTHTKYPTTWRTPEGTERVLKAGTSYIPLEYVWELPNGTKDDVVARIISRCPELANGWTLQAIADVRTCLRASAAIIDGRLRVLPAAPMADPPPDALERLFEQLEDHIAAGRVPSLEPAAAALLRERRDALTARQKAAAARQAERAVRARDTRTLFDP